MRPRVTAFEGCAVVVLALASIGVYRAAGVRFDPSTFPSYMQFIDEALLRDRFVESIWYSHAHPPGLNLLVGLAHNVLGDAASTFLAVLFNGLGVLVALALFALTLRLTGTRIAAYACTALVVFSPGFVLYENWLMYTFLEVALLMASAVALYKALDSGSTRWLVALFTTLSALVLTRGFFHLGWFVLVVVYVAWAMPHRLRVLKAAALPFAAATFWYAKNYFYFGVFAGSTMFGFGLSNIGTLTVAREELTSLVDQGILSPWALVSRYRDVNQLFDPSITPSTGIPLLDRPRKTSGDFNFDYLPLVSIDREYASDSFAVIRRYPASYAAGLLISNGLFFSPSSMNSYFSAANRAAVKPFERVFNPLLYGVAADSRVATQPHFGFSPEYGLEMNTSIWLIGWTALAVVLCCVRVYPVFLRRPIEDRTALLTLGFLLYVVVYVYALGTLVELGENYRYRFAAEPLLAVVSAVLATDAVRRIKTRWSRWR